MTPCRLLCVKHANARACTRSGELLYLFVCLFCPLDSGRVWQVRGWSRGRILRPPFAALLMRSTSPTTYRKVKIAETSYGEIFMSTLLGAADKLSENVRTGPGELAKVHECSPPHALNLCQGCVLEPAPARVRQGNLVIRRDSVN